MTPGQSAGPMETSSSVAEANTPPSATEKRTARVPAASDRTPVSERASEEDDGANAYPYLQSVVRRSAENSSHFPSDPASQIF